MNTVHDVRTIDDEPVDLTNDQGQQAVWVVTCNDGARLLDLIAALDTPAKAKILSWMASLPSAWFAAEEPARA